MIKSSNPFDEDEFVDKFLVRRAEHDSVNSTIDEPAILGLVADIKPDRVLELGCAAGGLTAGLCGLASSVLAVDSSAALVDRALERVMFPNVSFRCSRFEDLSLDEEFDCVVSGLALHLVEDLEGLLHRVFRWLKPNGHFIFSVRHPIRTALPTGSCVTTDRYGWTVSGYFDSGQRTYTWLGEDVTYYHRSTSQIFGTLTAAGFSVRDLLEPRPITAMESDRVLENLSVPAILLFVCLKST